jgi:hypothetical protein
MFLLTAALLQIAPEDGAFYVLSASRVGAPSTFGPRHQLYLLNHRRAEERVQCWRLVTTHALPHSELDEPLWLEEACEFLEEALRAALVRQLHQQDAKTIIGETGLLGLEEALLLNGFVLGRDQLRGFFLKAVPRDSGLTIDHFVETVQLLLATATPEGAWGVARDQYRLYRPPALLRLFRAQSEQLGQAAGPRALPQRVVRVLDKLREEKEDVLRLKCPHNLPLFAPLPDSVLVETT